MLIRRELLAKVTSFDEAFGRGYGEENDFCIRGADLGFRNVAVPSVFVEHREGVSFLGETKSLLAKNLAQINQRFPEYTPNIMAAESNDELRRGRWALDSHRLKRAADANQGFAVVINHALGGGTNAAISDIESAIGYGDSLKMSLLCREDAFLELRVELPSILAVFGPAEIEPLFGILSAARIKVVAVHSLLGFSEGFIRKLITWMKPYRSVCYVHDFYGICPRVTMIDALGEFCDAASSGVCNRCLAMDGSHESSRLSHLDSESHRSLFSDALSAFQHTVAPSASAADYYRRLFPNVVVKSIAHPETRRDLPRKPRGGNDDEIVLFGALGRHKGSRQLLEIAQRASLSHPTLRFQVIGYTDIDEELLEVGNVQITGKYDPSDLPRIVSMTKGRFALFLSQWPETYSYTLSECVRFGFIPIVPNIGALADRVTKTGFGVVFPFPFESVSVLRLFDGIKSGAVKLWRDGATPLSYSTAPDAVAAGYEVLNGSIPAQDIQAIETIPAGDRPKSPTRGRGRVPHIVAVNRRRSAPS
jgi:glycosyltransferase involved in cell wall biosynthesis